MFDGLWCCRGAATCGGGGRGSKVTRPHGFGAEVPRILPQEGGEKDSPPRLRLQGRARRRVAERARRRYANEMAPAVGGRSDRCLRRTEKKGSAAAAGSRQGAAGRGGRFRRRTRRLSAGQFLPGGEVQVDRPREREEALGEETPGGRSSRRQVERFTGRKPEGAKDRHQQSAGKGHAQNGGRPASGEDLTYDEPIQDDTLIRGRTADGPRGLGSIPRRGFAQGKDRHARRGSLAGRRIRGAYAFDPEESHRGQA